MVRPDPVVAAFVDNPFGQSVDAEAEDAYWRDAYLYASYFDTSRSWEDFAPAYRLGYEGRQCHRGSFATMEADLAREWYRVRGDSSLEWNQARDAVRDAWERIERLSQGGLWRDGL
jgi:hypothetical protein